MELTLPIKIWRYMDLEKFISLVTNRGLYFSCPCQFDDPYEGHYTKSQIEAFSEIFEKSLNDSLAFRNQLAENLISALNEVNDKEAEEKVKSFMDFTDDNHKKVIATAQEATKISSLKFGVNCWHKSEYESEAMWKLYSSSGQGIAIESTNIQLADSISSKIRIGSVRYCDFDNEKIEKGHQDYGLFQKRKSFEHEKEFRATILLQHEGIGMLVSCNLDVLINNIYLSPNSKPHVRDDIENLCKKLDLNKPVIRSSLFDKPNYGIKITAL